MPDLAKVAAQLVTYPDVYIRDSVGDSGVVPSASVFQSPDIIVRGTASPNPQAEYGEGSPLANQTPPNDPVVVGGNNHVYVRLRNRSGVNAPGVTAYLYWSEASTLVAPIDWHPIGQIAAGMIPAGGALTVAGPLLWNPAAGVLPGHGCLVAVLDQAMDPMPPSLPAAVGINTLGWTEFLAYVGASNNVAWRNITIVEAPEDAPGPWPFSIRGSWEAARDFLLELETDVPERVRLVLELPAELADLLEAQPRHGLPPGVRAHDRVAYVLSGIGRLIAAVRLPRRAEYRCVLRLDDRAAAEVGGMALTIRQAWDRVNVGQLTWRVTPHGSDLRPCSQPRHGDGPR
jgi:hypothetical protein